VQGDILRGGKGDKAKPSDFDPRELRMGIKVEMEHTKSRRLAREIAMDHLSEDPRYYSKLRKIHKESTMESVEELLQLCRDVHAELSEATPPPFKAADRAKQGMPALKTRTGATPPPIPKAKPKVLAQGPTKAVVHSPTPKGDKSLGIKRGFSMHTAAGAKSQPHVTQALSWAKEKVQQRAAKGESFSRSVDEIRSILGEASAKYLKPMKPMKPIGGNKVISKPEDWKLKKLAKLHKIQ
jgi:hypothetical protein